VRAGARCGLDVIDRCRRSLRCHELAGWGQLGRVALEQRHTEVFGRAVSVLERRVVACGAAAVVMVAVVFVLGRRRLFVRLDETVVGVVAVRMLAVHVLALVRGLRDLVDVHQSMEPGQHDQDERDRRQTDPGSEGATSPDAGRHQPSPLSGSASQ
jgi:hypothetical protein